MSTSGLREKLLGLTALRYRLMPALFDILHRGEPESRATLLGAIMQCHLFVESALVELMRFSLGSAAEAVLAARLTFDQKLTIVSRLILDEDWPLLSSEVVASLRVLNAIRNKMAHRLEHEVDDDDIRRLFHGLHENAPYGDVLEGGQVLAFSRDAAWIAGHMLPKYEQDPQSDAVESDGKSEG